MNEVLERYFNLYKNLRSVNEIVNEIFVLDHYAYNYVEDEAVACIDYCVKKYNKEIKEIIENKKLFKGLLLDLRNLSGLSLRQMAEIFRINKDKINKIINSNP